MIFNGAQCDVLQCRLQGHSFWAIQANAGASGSAVVCFIVDSVIGDVRIDQNSNFTDVRRCRLVDSGNRSVDANSGATIFNVGETFIGAVVGGGSGIFCADNAYIATDGYLDIDGCALHGMFIFDGGVVFTNTLFGAVSTQVYQNNGGWGVFTEKGGMGAGVQGATYSGNVSGTFTPVTAIVGGTIPLSVGAALSFSIQGKPNVAVAFFGDGATNEGSFHESLNLAAIWKLPA